MLKQRVASALVVIPIVLAAVYMGGWPLFMLLLAVSCLALRELYTLASVRNRRLRLLGFAGNAVALVALFISGLEIFYFMVVIFFLLLNVFWVVAFPIDLRELAVLLWGKMYVTALLAFFLLLRALPGGFSLMLVVLLAVWVSDSGAYFIGLSLGRHRLLPAVSPKKSWEGALGGLVSSTAVLFVIAPYFGLSRPFAMILGFLLSLAGQLGDLSESALKRWSQVKDSGSFLPGHGGMLDRLDSLLFAAPAAYFLFRMFNGG